MPPTQVPIPASEPRQRSTALQMENCFLPLGLLVLLHRIVPFSVLCHCWWEAQVPLSSAALLLIVKLFMQPKSSPDVYSNNGAVLSTQAV